MTLPDNDHSTVAGDIVIQASEVLDVDMALAAIAERIDESDPALSRYAKIARAVFLLGKPVDKTPPNAVISSLSPNMEKTVQVSAFFDFVGSADPILSTLGFSSLRSEGLLRFVDVITLPMTDKDPIKNGYLLTGLTTPAQEQERVKDIRDFYTNGMARFFAPMDLTSETGVMASAAIEDTLNDAGITLE